jgi:hypothetical protein
LAVIDLVFATLSPTDLTNIRADSADFLGKPRTATHEGCGRPTGFGTIVVEPNTFSHRGHVPLTQAGFRAVFALFGTADTGFDTALMLVVAHRNFSAKEG